MSRVGLAERAAYSFELDQPTTDQLHIKVETPTGGRAQWWVLPVNTDEERERLHARRRAGYRVRSTAPEKARYALCPRPDTLAVIAYFDTYDRASKAAMIRARKWLGSHWGLRSAARRLP